MKLDDDVKMISAEAPVLFSKAAELFITELTLRAWIHTEDNKRRTLQRNDIAMAISKYDQFDFLIDIVPRDELKPHKTREETPSRPASSVPDQVNGNIKSIRTWGDLGSILLGAVLSPAGTAEPTSSSAGGTTTDSNVECLCFGWPATNNSDCSRRCTDSNYQCHASDVAGLLYS